MACIGAIACKIYHHTFPLLIGDLAYLEDRSLVLRVLFLLGYLFVKSSHTSSLPKNLVKTSTKVSPPGHNPRSNTISTRILVYHYMRSRWWWSGGGVGVVVVVAVVEWWWWAESCQDIYQSITSRPQSKIKYNLNENLSLPLHEVEIVVKWWWRWWWWWWWWRWWWWWWWWSGGGGGGGRGVVVAVVVVVVIMIQ